MRVLFLCSGLDPKYGGPPVSEASLCRELKERCELEPLCPEGRIVPSFAASYGLTNVRTFNRADVLRAFRDKNHWLSQAMSRAQVFHQTPHWDLTTALVARFAHFRGTPFILHPRGTFFIGHRKVLLKRVFNSLFKNWSASHAAAVIALSRFETVQFAPYPIPTERIVVIPNGIDFPKASDLSGDSPWGSERPFVYLGRMEHRKNILFLIEAFSAYRTEGGEARLALVGPVEFGYDEIVHQRVKSLGLDSYVSFVSPQYEGAKWRYLKNARGVIYPATDEAFGRVPFEAVAAGVVPIIPRASGSAEYLADFFPRTLFETENLASLVSAMKACEKSEEKVAPAQQWLRDELDWEKIASKVLALYERVGKKA